MPQYLNELADLYDKPLSKQELYEANITDTDKVVTMRVSDHERFLLAIISEYTEDFASLCTGINGSTPPITVLKKMGSIQEWLRTVWDQSPMLKQIIRALPLSAESSANFARLNARSWLPDAVEEALSKPNIEKLVIIDDRAGQRSTIAIPKSELQGIFS